MCVDADGTPAEIATMFIRGSTMKTLTIKGLPEAVYRQLKQRAARHHRSLNREVILCLEQAVGTQRVDPDEILVRADRVREQLRVPPLTEAELEEARR